MKLKQTWVLMGLLAVGIRVAHAKDTSTSEPRIGGQKITLARYAKAFVGENNVTLEVAPYKTEKGEGAILLFKGVESPWDGKAINHVVRPAAYQGSEYVAQVDGRPYISFQSRRSADKVTYEAFLPGLNDAISLVPSDGAAQLTTPSAIYQEFLAQQAGK